MTDEQDAPKKASGASKILWLLVALAIVLLWWFFRPEGSHKVAQPLDAEAAAAIDHDDVIVDLKDDASPAAIERDLGIQLTLVDQSGEAAATKLYRAHVDPAREQPIIAALQKRSDVEIAEPDSIMALSPEEMQPIPVAETQPTDPGYPTAPLS